MDIPSAHAPLAAVAGWGDEQQLVASADVAAGMPLVVELPIAFIETLPDQDEPDPWLLLESILADEATYERVVAHDLKLTKWPLSAEDEETLEHLAKKYRRNPKKLAQLYHRVAANNIRYAQAGLSGLGIWPVLSRSNHSCDPNAQLRATPKRALAEVLLATRNIAQGEAICWNYFSEPSFLALDWRERNLRLHRDFQFLCRCPRCEAERPAEVAAMSKAELAAYFGAQETASAGPPVEGRAPFEPTGPMG